MKCATCGTDINNRLDQYGNLYAPQCWACWQVLDNGELDIEEIKLEVAGIDDEIDDLRDEIEFHEREIDDLEGQIADLIAERARLNKKLPAKKIVPHINLRDLWKLPNEKIQELKAALEA
jgi:peptidoglycan hydrolase CwlO-like protein